jgi:histone-lysine N-methyltransferase SETD1
MNVVEVTDPREKFPRFSAKNEAIELPVPQFSVDSAWVAPLPPKKIGFSGLNDNVQEEFLKSLCAKFGPVKPTDYFALQSKFCKEKYFLSG